MADKSVGELIAAQSVTPTDLFVLEQNGTAKKLTGQILENWLVSFADGHGGIQSIAKLSTSGLADTYRITLADTTTFDFVVTNGRGITGISKTSTSGLVDTYTISYNNGTTGTFTVTNGEKGDKGDNAYVWIKYASQEPTESSHSMGDIPDDWIGIYYGNSSTAPTDWQQYKWFKHKGEQGDTGSPATLVNKSVTYQVSDSGTITPSGSWGSSIPVVSQGKYLWTKTELRFNTGDPIVSYSVTRMGIDGSGSVSSVAGVSPDANGNVALTAADVGALAASGGDMTGAINMNGQPISGLSAPIEDTEPATKAYSENANNLKTGTVPEERLPSVPVTKGGTGRGSVTSGAFLIGNGTDAMQEASAQEVLNKINTVSGNAIRSMLCYANLEGTGIATSSMTTEAFVIAMPVNMTISFTHRTPDEIHLTDAPADYGIVVLTKGTAAGYVIGEFMDNSGNCYVYSRTNGWEKINAGGGEIGVSSGSGTRSTTYTTEDAFGCTYTKYGRIAIVSFAATMNSSAGNTWADYEVATAVPKALSQSRGIVLLGSGNTVTCAVTTSGAIRVVSRETSVAGKIVIGSVAYVTAS